MDTTSPSNLMKLTSRQEVAQQTMAFRFEKPASFTFTPGQFIELTLVNPPESDAQGNSRVFSIASAPDEDFIMVANDLLAGCGADIMVQGQHLDAGDLLDHRFHDRAGRFDQMGPHLLQQVPPLLGRKRLDQMLFGRGQHALKADHEEIAEQVGINVLGPPAHVVLLKATDSFTNGGLDFSLGSHGRPPC